MTRRDLSGLLPALIGAVAASSLRADSTDSAPTLLHSHAYHFDELPVHKSAGGGISRPVFDGLLPTGEHVELHETTLQPGQMPHPAHRHKHSEMMLIREGTIDFIMENKTERLTAGGVAFCGSGELHGLRNSGTTPAQYFVIAIGTEPKSA
jgi:quercetin dioxygenase-like cupin family protein